MRLKTALEEILSLHTGQSIDRIATDTDRDFVMSAEEAKEYGLIDEVLTSRDASTTRRPSAPSSERRSGSAPRFTLAISDPWKSGPRGDRSGLDVAKFGDGGELLKCSFCGKSQKQVKKLIAGPGRLHLRRVHRPLQRDHRGGALRDLRAALRRAPQAA